MTLKLLTESVGQVHTYVDVALVN